MTASIRGFQQLNLFPQKDKPAQLRQARSGTFADNMKLPVHRWFRYSAGFSADWAQQKIAEYRRRTDGDIKVLDPFAGSGTTLLAAESLGVKAVGFEAHPFICRVAQAKLGWTANAKLLKAMANELLAAAESSQSGAEIQNTLLKKCFSPESFSKLNGLKNIFLEQFQNGGKESELLWLAITSIVRPCSTAGTAQWQYVLPEKKKANVLDPFTAFSMKIGQIAEDIVAVQQEEWFSSADMFLTDARSPEHSPSELFDLVITSPPYPNNYDYADATRLEMTFWGEVQGWGDIHASVRRHLLRSCSQHTSKEKLLLEELLADNVLLPIKSELSRACMELEKVRLTKGGKKTYHTMAAAYFADLAQVFHALRPLCKKRCRMCFVIGDSAPYGVHLSAEKWLGELALAAGFTSYSFEKIRDRNIKWKNRKHDVPLQEGRLWIEG